MYVSAVNTHLLALDNISFSKQWFSDVLCQIATGGDYEARTHHSMGETTRLSAHNPVILGSIAQVSSAPDVLRRSVYLKTKYLGKDHTRHIGEFWDSFFSDLPYIYSGYLNLLVQVLRDRESIDSTNIESMSDFWITGRTLGKSVEWTVSFDQAMDRMSKVASEELKDQNPLVQLMIQHYEDQSEQDLGLKTSEWANVLLTKSDDIDKDYLIKQVRPHEARGLGREFVKIQPLLRKLGYSFEQKDITGGSLWVLSHPEKNSIDSINSINRDKTPPSENGNNGINGNNFDLFNQATGNHKTHDF
jgi:hypothetical protein